jgi:hypothetical protein
MADHRKDHISAFYNLKVVDSAGNVVKTVEAESDSFVRNFLLLLQAGFQNAAVATTDVNGVSRACLGFNSLAAAVGVTNSNIVVGSGTTPVTPSDYKLESQITFLEHVQLLLTQPTAPVVNGSNIESRMFRRSFNNRTGAAVLVNEIGVYVISSTYSIMILRDVLGTSISVGNNQTLQIEYIVRTAV